MIKSFLGLALLIMVIPSVAKGWISVRLSDEELLLKDVDKIPIRYLETLKWLRNLTVEFKHGARLERGTFKKLNHLTSLQIVSSNLESIHTSAFMGLKNLKHLSIWDTNITGSLNSGAFRVLPSLQLLSLVGCRIPKLSPRTLERLPSLSHVVFRRNRIALIESIALYNLPLLYRLNLHFNDMKEIRPNAFSNLQNLNLIQLAENKFGTLHPNCFHNLPNLRNMDLYGNKINTFRPNAFNNMENLLGIHLISNRIIRLPTNSFFNYPKLKVLNIWYNTIQDIEPNAFHTLPALEDFRLEGNKIKLVQNYAFYDLHNVKRMELWCNNFTVIEPLAFQNLHKPNTDGLDCRELERSSVYSFTLHFYKREMQKANQRQQFSPLAKLMHK